MKRFTVALLLLFNTLIGSAQLSPVKVGQLGYFHQKVQMENSLYCITEPGILYRFNAKTDQVETLLDIGDTRPAFLFEIQGKIYCIYNYDDTKVEVCAVEGSKILYRTKYTGQLPLGGSASAGTSSALYFVTGEEEDEAVVSFDVNRKVFTKLMKTNDFLYGAHVDAVGDSAWITGTLQQHLATKNQVLDTVRGLGWYWFRYHNESFNYDHRTKLVRRRNNNGKTIETLLVTKPSVHAYFIELGNAYYAVLVNNTTRTEHHYYKISDLGKGKPVKAFSVARQNKAPDPLGMSSSRVVRFGRNFAPATDTISIFNTSGILEHQHILVDSLSSEVAVFHETERQLYCMAYSSLSGYENLLQFNSKGDSFEVVWAKKGMGDGELIVLNNVLYYFVGDIFKFGNVATSTKLEAFPAASFLVYPNPAHKLLRLQLDEAWTGSLQKVSIYTSTGKLVKEIKGDVYNETISVDELPAGLYHIRLASAQGSGVSHFIKK